MQSPSEGVDDASRRREGLGAPQDAFEAAAAQFDPEYRRRWDDFWRYVLTTGESATFLKPSDDFAMDASLAGMTAQQIATLRSGTYRGEADPAPLGVWLEGDALQDRRLVDLGCGLAYLTGRISHAASFCLGVDISPFAVHLARGLTYASDNIEIVGVSESGRLREQAGTFDTVIARGFFAHLPFDDAVALASVGAALLKPGGRMSIAFYMHDPDAPAPPQHTARSPRNLEAVTVGYHYDEADLQALADAAGLTIHHERHQPETSQRFVLFERA